VGDYQEVAKQRDISVTTDVSGPLVAIADGDRVGQVIANLLNNAVKFTPAGGHIVVTANRTQEHIHLSVADDGPGIPVEKQATIFEAFQQGGLPDRRGLGLGLYITRNLVQAHRGKIWVESTPGTGCSFHVTLPVT
jgi:signal transduction histidine kinase